MELGMIDKKYVTMGKRLLLVACFFLLSAYSKIISYAQISTVSGNDIMIETVSGNDAVIEPEEKTVPVTELDLGEYLTEMVVGTKQLLSVTVLPYDATEQNCHYESTNTSVATINGMGRIVAVAVGSTEIKVTCGKVSTSFSLNVVEENGIKVTDIEIGHYEDEIEVDSTGYISANVLPANATDSTVKYSSSDTSIATITSNGEVKGLKAGKVIIYVTAGSITKEVPLTVKVATTQIKLNSNYLVLLPESTFQLETSVIPADAVQKVTYRTVDADIATVSENGLVMAKGEGSTSVLVSNGDAIVSVSVIVNQMVEEIDVVEMEELKNSEINFPKELEASVCKVIDSEMLHYLYSMDESLKIYGEGYTLEIHGDKIRNFENELYTDINLYKEEQGIRFSVNKDGFLCGEIELYLDDMSGGHLYLYNVSKDKYEMLDVENFEQLTLSSPGEYLITEDKIEEEGIRIRFVFIIGGILSVIGIVGYICVKKTYWFW